MIADFVVEEGKHGLRLVLTSAWNPEVRRYMEENKIAGLVLNYARGWVGDSISFVTDLPFLREFVIVDWKIKEVSPVHELKQLRSLQVSTYCNTSIQFDNFPDLEDCGLRWRNGSESLFVQRTLKHLFLSDSPLTDSSVVAEMIGLESLSISTSSIKDVWGIGNLRRLRTLGLYHLKQLENLTGLEGIPQLEELEIVDCRKVENIEPIGELVNLRKLILGNDGSLKSLKPLRGHKYMQWLTFPESTNIVDGDLSVLLELPSLRKVAFQNRRHYSHSREQISAILAR